MNYKLFAAVLVGVGASVLGTPAAEANHRGGAYYYQTPPFVPGYGAPSVEASPYGVRINQGGYYEDPGYYQPRPTYRSGGCQYVDDRSDYDAIHQIDYRNRPAVYRAQQNLYAGQCKVLRVRGHGDDTYLAIDSRSIRWATQKEIGNYHRYRY